MAALRAGNVVGLGIYPEYRLSVCIVSFRKMVSCKRFRSKACHSGFVVRCRPQLCNKSISIFSDEKHAHELCLVCQMHSLEAPVTLSIINPGRLKSSKADGEEPIELSLGDLP